MSVRHHRPARAALAALTAAGLAAGALVAAAPAHAGKPPAPVALYGSTDPTYDGVYRQSLAILGQHAAGATIDPAAVRWLAGQQCTNGGFTSFDADTDTRCTATDDIDSNATALAAQALLAVGRTTEGLAAATLLRDSQVETSGGQPDGGWEYTLGAGWVTDPNSSGLALTALAAAGLEPAHDPTPVFASRQAGRTGVTVENAALPFDEGSIAYSVSGDFAGPDVLATVQSIPGLNGLALSDLGEPDAWSPDPEDYGTEPETDPEVAGWATTWLAKKVGLGQVSDSALGWAVLSFASEQTAREDAEDAYASLRARTLDVAQNPAALGLASLAATVLGETDDADRFAALTAQTLGDPVVTEVPPVKPTPDTTRPTVSLTKPAKAKKVSSWRTLRGTSADASSGVKTVSVRAVQKRSGDWFAYNGKTWKKKATLKKANKAARAVVVTPRADGDWKLRLKKLKQGTLKVRVQATDGASNRSKVAKASAKLTKK